MKTKIDEEWEAFLLGNTQKKDDPVGGGGGGGIGGGGSFHSSISSSSSLFNSPFQQPVGMMMAQDRKTTKTERTKSDQNNTEKNKKSKETSSLSPSPSPPPSKKIKTKTGNPAISMMNPYKDDEEDEDDTEEMEIDEDDAEEVDEDPLATFLVCSNSKFLSSSTAPESSPIYISTKTKIAYLNRCIDIHGVFWKIPIVSYSTPIKGVIKKQIKFNCLLKEELEEIQEKLKRETYFEEHVITHIDNPEGRIKFKDIRKVSIGISKKDIMSYRNKKKSAFYNCFVMILRLKIDDLFKEFHVKIFNTGKLEIPGIQTDESFQMILDYVLEVLSPLVNEPTSSFPSLGYKKDAIETVLINSNFNCGYYINREVFYDILRYKYNIHAIYDPCSYPGVQCKFYFNPDLDIQSGSQISEENKQHYKDIKEVSFMIFRTGSVLIVGKCDESVLLNIYDFLKTIFLKEYCNIGQKLNTDYMTKSDDVKKKKIRKKIITTTMMTPSHADSLMCSSALPVKTAA